MTYQETLHYLYTSIPVFQHRGPSAYKPGLGTSIALDNHLGNPHKAYRIVHVGGTNGKGSVSHTIAAILQQSGYKVGLYTSPHLVDFRERIRVNGEMISEQYVIDFVEQHRSFFEPLHPSFFELTSGMAMQYFKDQQVDFAVIEVGLGGRLDSTNILSPIMSVVTNISLDHTQFLGDTVEQIASEKAGIFKRDVPALLGESYQDSVYEVFRSTAERVGAPFHFAQEMHVVNEGSHLTEKGKWLVPSVEYGDIEGELGGEVQVHNARTVLAAVHLLNKDLGVKIQPEAVHEGFAHVTTLTGLMGRWQTLRSCPTVVCDTGHNIGGWRYISEHLRHVQAKHDTLHIVIGMVNDKDINGVLAMMPKDATYYFTRASVDRALPAEEVATLAQAHGLNGTTCASVKEATELALSRAKENDFIFIGGSTFIVADALPLFQ